MMWRESLRSVVRAALGLPVADSTDAARPKQDGAQPEKRARPPVRPTQTPHAPVYPPLDPGLVAVAAAELLDSQAALVARIRSAAGVDDVVWEARYLRPIRHLAEYIQSVPASETGAYCGPGGLLRLCLEMAFYSLQATAGAMFSGHEGSEAKRRLEPRWQYATFLAGLLAETPRLFAGLTVTTADGVAWAPYESPLSKWLEKRNASAYYVRWVPGVTANPAMTAMLLNDIVPRDALQYLRDGSERVVQGLIATITQTIPPNERSTIRDIVHSVRNKLLARDAALQPATYGKATVGVTLAPHVIDALRALVAECGAGWVCNEPKAIVWRSTEGLFLVWRTAAKAVSDRLRLRGIEGMPTEADTLAELLIGAGFAERGPAGGLYFEIVPDQRTGRAYDALRIPLVEAIYGSAPTPEALPGRILASALNGAAADVDVAQRQPSVPPPSAATGSEQHNSKPPTAKPAPNEGTSTKEKPAEPQAAPSVQASLLAEAPNSATPAGVGEGSQKGNPDMLATIPEKERLVLMALREDILAGKLDKKFTWNKGTGLAVPYKILDSYGSDANRLLIEMDKRGWVLHNPEKKTSKLTPIEIEGEKCPCVVILGQVALDLGFIGEAGG